MVVVPWVSTAYTCIIVYTNFSIMFSKKATVAMELLHV